MLLIQCAQATAIVMPSSSAGSNEEKLSPAADGSVESGDVLHGALRQSELDLAELRHERSRSEAEVARLSSELDVIHVNLRALERKFEKQERFDSSRDAELLDLRHLLGEMALAADDLRIVQAEERRNNGALHRRIAELSPEAASNTVALQLLRDLRAELSALRAERDTLAREVGSRAERPVAPLRRRLSGLAQRLMTGG